MNWILILAFSLLPILASAQDAVRSVPLASGYDVASTDDIFCYTADNSGNIWSAGTEIDIPVTTSGASSTVTAVTASSAPFARVAVGDELIFNVDGTQYRRYITAKASSDSITISGFPTATINLGDAKRGTAGYGFWYRTRTCSTSDTAGWVPVRGQSSVVFDVVVSTINATSITATLYCRGGGSVQRPVSVWTETYTAVGGDLVALTGPLKYEACRMAIKLNTDGGAQAVTLGVSR